jgi:hypothetical protein
VAVRQRTEHHPGIAFHGLQANVLQQGLRDEQAGGLGFCSGVMTRFEYRGERRGLWIAARRSGGAGQALWLTE